MQTRYTYLFETFHRELEVFILFFFPVDLLGKVEIFYRRCPRSQGTDINGKYSERKLNPDMPHPRKWSPFAASRRSPKNGGKKLHKSPTFTLNSSVSPSAALGGTRPRNRRKTQENTYSRFYRFFSSLPIHGATGRIHFTKSVLRPNPPRSTKRR